MTIEHIQNLLAQTGATEICHQIGRVDHVESGKVLVSGFGNRARIGDRLRLLRRQAESLEGEIVQVSQDFVTMLPEGEPIGVGIGDRVALIGEITFAPCRQWIGRVVDPFGRPMDGRPLMRGHETVPLQQVPPNSTSRRGMGQRLETGMMCLNTLLPIARGQRIGLFAGSGVGKSSLMAHLAKHMQADVVVLAMIGERGREVRDFVVNTLGPEGMQRSVVVAATSDQSPLIRRRCAWSAMAVAEYFRDQGLQVLLLADSITRFAEAHREVAVSSGELPALRGFPPSMAHQIMKLCERAGPGSPGSGDITAVFNVLVAGSDMDEPVADTLRGVLDGHIVLDRSIAERGRFPAIDLLKSVSRSLPDVASTEENALLVQSRRMLGAYEKSQTMIRAGLYAKGTDPALDVAIAAWPELDQFIGEIEPLNAKNSFQRLELLLRRAESKNQNPMNAAAPRPLAQPQNGVLSKRQ